MTFRRPLIAANWKMNGNRELVQATATMLQSIDCPHEILICPPVIFLADFPKSTKYCLGAQNTSSEKAGPFTGEISADMIRAVGAEYVILGHSERRSLYGETDATVLQKAQQAIAAGVTPIICFGETLSERQQEKTMWVLAQHLDAVYAAHPDLLARSVIAYEPVWAIGTGLTATPEQAQQVHAFIRQHLARIDQQAAAQVRILYGGSVNAENWQTLFSQPDIDGALVGGASLKPAEFAAICQMAKE
ncbi:triose-phosphate isomerase [Rheinheimera tilapiae]|uniref:Triosephosphate isomerase n=1 Tax=Rheinheimera tilapiae TaxID=875043 RepID=A0ABV6BA46_9GAMM